MPKAHTFFCFLISMSAGLSQYSFADVSAKFELASNRVFRGIQQTESELVPLASIKYSANDNWHLGALLTESELGRLNESSPEARYFIGYGRDLNKRIGIDMSYTNYQYNTSGRRDWDWQEVQVQFSLDGQWAMSVGYSKNWLWRDEKSTHADLSYIHPLPLDLNLQTTIGAVYSENPMYQDYHYGEIGLIYPITGSSYARLNLATSDARDESVFTDSGGEQITASIGYLF